jgi:hypothetical protein
MKNKRKENRDHWSNCSQVYFTYGKGYGLTNELQTICLGDETEIYRFFETGELSSSLNPIQEEVLLKIFNYREEKGYGKPRRTSVDGRDVDGYSRGRKEAVRPFAERERAPLC